MSYSNFVKCKKEGYDPRVQAKVSELVDAFAANLKLEVEKLYRSGFINVEKYDSFEYALPKILVSAAIERTKDDFGPAPWDKSRRKEVANLIHV